MNLRLWILPLLLLLPGLLFAQSDSKSYVYQFSGLVVSRTSGEPVPYVRINVNHTRRGAMSNSEGFYSIPVGLGDTLYFNHLGYYPSKLIVIDYLADYQGDKSQYIYAINYMLEDTLTLPEVVIFPYDTPEELKTAVINMDFPENSPQALAQQNMDPSTLHTLMATLPVDGNERLMVARQQYFDFYQTQQLIPVLGLDPLMATRLLQEVVRRSKKKVNKDLNYWED
jgi:hypothetical protein